MSLPSSVTAPSPPRIMATAEVLNIALFCFVFKTLYEDKTNEVCELLNSPGKVLLQSNDQIITGNAA